MCVSSTSSSEERTTFSTASFGLDLAGDATSVLESGAPFDRDDAVMVSVGAEIEVSTPSLDSQKDKSSSSA